MDKIVGSILEDNYGSQWKILLYKGEILRAFNTKYFALSEAAGNNIDQLISELEAIEEITITNLIGGKQNEKN
jgi:hypothetical protein